MLYKRIIYSLLYSNGFFYLSRNFRLQKVGDVNWLKNNFGFGETCDYIDELMILLVTKEPNKNEIIKYFKDINKLREKIFVPITLGGAVRSFDYARECFANGADKILINYLAHKNNKTIKEISNIYGEQAISIMVDYKKVKNLNFSFMNSSTIKSKPLNEYFKIIKKINFGELIMNSIDKDGTGTGLDFSCLKELPKNFNRPILIMGGAGKPEHFTQAFAIKNISGVVTANLFNFLGSGLRLVREHSVKNGVKLIKFN